ncbi:hypothetical protein QSH57_015383 [Fusarium oxysporum f. sp. vasinfectum]|nr:hypothetical protein QSH57_015383 [Fusarium oxysporum f. sp. vasinfectum]
MSTSISDSSHEKLAFMRDTIPRLEAFVTALPKHANELNLVKLRLAHKDLHFANIIFDPLLGKITAILDWEFAGVVPYPQWNPEKLLSLERDRHLGIVG